MSGTSTTTARVWDQLRRWGLDVALLLALLVVGLLYMPGINDSIVQAQNHPLTVWAEAHDLPFWATVDDLLLVGPDAGAWASSAHAVHQGDWGALDAHRMPTFSSVVAAMLWFTPDVAMAGHLLNHLAMLLLPLVIYALGRIGGGHGVGFGAGFLVACCGPLLNASRLYGVDPLIFFLIPTSLLATAAVRRWWWLAPGAGLLVAAATASHFTTLPMWLPPLLLLLLWGPRPWWKRLLAVLLFLGVGAGVLWLTFRVFPFPTMSELAGDVSEGIAPGSRSTQQVALNAEALAILRSGMGSATERAVNSVMLVLRPSWTPWYLALALPWLGALGAGMARVKASVGAVPVWKRMLRSFDIALGIVLLSYLAPLPIFAAANAPDRYGWNLLPIAALLIMRGFGSLCLMAEHGIRQLWGRWPLGLLAMVAAVAVAWAAWNNGHAMRYVLPPSMDGQEVRQLGELIEAHFDHGGGAVCSVRESAAHAGRQYCPRSPCPISIGEKLFEQCMLTMNKECGGSGPLPSIIIEQAHSLPHTALDPGGGKGPRSAEKVAFDEWIAGHYQPVASYEARQFLATLYSIPRDDLVAGTPTETEKGGD
jgi:hypothetical protein